MARKSCAASERLLSVLLVLLTLLVEVQAAKHKHGLEFDRIVQALPDGFVVGTASASYQVEGAVNEGGRGPTIWDTFSHLDPPKVARGENGDVACDSYHRYEEDADLMKEGGFEGARMSIAWSRIYPEGDGDEPNAEGVQHYHDVIDALLDRGLEPMITLYHWDLPQALEDKYGGWLNASIVPIFNAYADTCFKEYGGKVKKWLTINEPWSFVHHGYSTGVHAPGRCSDRSFCDQGDSFTEPYIAGHNVLNAHAKAVYTYRTKYKAEQGGEIGITLNCDWGMPLDPHSQEDKETAMRYVDFQLGWWADPIYFGDYPSSMRDRIGMRLPVFTEEERTFLVGSNDFFGLNHYTSWYLTDIPGSTPPREGTSPAKALAANISLPVTSPGDGWAQDMGGIQTKADLNGVINGVLGETDWLTVVPAGFRPLLKLVSTRYGHPIIMVTENGMDRAGESNLPVEEAVEDVERQKYYQGYIESMVAAMMEDAVDVRGYYAWSILDNFEWSDGYRPRFGLTYVDYENGLKRTPKDSWKWFAKLAVARRDYRRRQNTHDGDIHGESEDDSADGSEDDSGDNSGRDSSHIEDSGPDGLDSSDDEPATVGMAAEDGAGAEQDLAVGVPEGPVSREEQAVGETPTGLITLCLALGVVLAGVGFGLGKYNVQRGKPRYEEMRESPAPGW